MHTAPPLDNQAITWCGETLLQGVQLEQGGRVHEAVALYSQVAERIGRPDRSARLWAMAHLNLGCAHQSLSEADSTHAETAVAAYMEAIAVPGGLEQEAVASTCESLAYLLLTHWPQQTLALVVDWARQVERDPDNTAHLVQLMAALRAMIDPERSTIPWACVTMALGNSLRSSNDAMSNSHARAIALYREALAQLSPEAPPNLQAALHGELGYTLSIALSGERGANIEAAIAACEAACEIFLREHEMAEYATAMASLSNSYLQRVQGERADNIERAIRAAHEAVRIRAEQRDPAHDDLLPGLADAYIARIQGDRADNIEHALALLLPLRDTTRCREDVAFRRRLHGILGTAYLARGKGNRSDNLEEALRATLQTAELTAPGGRDWIVVRLNLSAAYLQRELGTPVDNLRNAIAALDSARAALSRDTMPLDWADCTTNLGTAHFMLAQHSAAPAQERALGVGYYHQALAIRTLAEFPAHHRFIQRNVGLFHFLQGEWALAWQAYQATMQAGELLLDDAYTEAGRVAEVRDDINHFNEASYCLLQLGRPDEALALLDRGKTRLLVNTLELGEAALDRLLPEQDAALKQRRRTIRTLEATLQQNSGVGSAGQQLAIAEALRSERLALRQMVQAAHAVPAAAPSPQAILDRLAALPQPGGALIVPLVTGAGGAVFVLPGGTTSVEARHVVWLDQSAAAALLGMDAALPSHEAIEALCTGLWQHLMRPVVDRLHELGIGPGAPLLLLPQGRLAGLPLHAAWRPQGGHMRSVIDDYPVTYAPSGYVMARCNARARDARRVRGTLLAVVDPTGDLAFARHEGEAIGAHFAPADRSILAGPAATVQGVLDAVHEQGFLHFSCHNHTDRDDPMRSALVLADGRLDIAGIRKHLDLGGVRLVTLSACDTALTDREQSSDEFRGLATEFLLAGAPAVLSTLWPVADLSAMLLMDRFYYLLLQEGQPIATALQGAQRWLKALTAAQVARRMAEEEERLFDEGGARLAAVSRQFSHFHAMPPAAHPFAQPYHAAAFVVSGA